MASFAEEGKEIDVLVERKDMEVDDIGGSRKTLQSESPLFWFEVQARAFLYSKSSKTWGELGLGKTEFRWNPRLEKVSVQFTCNSSGALRCDHVVELTSKLDAQAIISQQSWVFRAQRRLDLSLKDVLCLQFPTVSLAQQFCTMFEQQRSQQQRKKSASNVRKYRSNVDNNTTRVMRRRLTVSGGDPRLDGHEVGASQDSGSAQPTSPKSLRNGMVGQWPFDFSTGTAPGVAQGAVQVVAYSGVSRKGIAPYNPDKQNQDSMIMAQLPFNGYCNGELLLACFDGHGAEGHHVSRHIAAHLPKLLCSSPKFAQDEHTGSVLSDAMLELEKELIQNNTIDTSLSGTTAVVSVLRGNKLFVANIGDSRIIKGSAVGDSGRVQAHDLSIDHKPDDERETKRITSMGGRVFAMKYDDGIDGPARVWLSYADMPGLAMSRSICDTIGKEAGVISNAELHVHELVPGKDKFVVIATDGLWEFMSSQDVADIVTSHMNSGRDPSDSIREAIRHLAQESEKRWRKEEPVVDDTTIVVAYLA